MRTRGVQTMTTYGKCHTSGPGQYARPGCLQAARAGLRHIARMEAAQRAARMHGFLAHTGLHDCLADKVMRGTPAHEHARSVNRHF